MVKLRVKDESRHCLVSQTFTSIGSWGQPPRPTPTPRKTPLPASHPLPLGLAIPPRPPLIGTWNAFNTAPLPNPAEVRAFRNRLTRSGLSSKPCWPPGALADSQEEVAGKERQREFDFHFAPGSLFPVQMPPDLIPNK